ncbi:MAG: hypothetical protein IKR66_05125 [Bacteroidales bacterium]|nr:hypothetical protein [Bacteroidales bacterium]
MNKIKLVGIHTEEALRLWYGPETKIGVFASRDFDANDYQLEQWATEMGRFHQCLVGTFHSDAEHRILDIALANGAFAVWIRGCDLPRTYRGEVEKAMKNDHLLTLSCFHRQHHNEATARYCIQLASKCTKNHAFFLNENDSLLESVYRKVARHPNTQLFSK